MRLVHMVLVPKLREDTTEVIKNFIREKVETSNAKGVVVGVSGGLDSTVVTKLCAEALGPKRVFALALPDELTPKSEVQEVLDFCKRNQIKCKVINISKPLEALTNIISKSKIDKTVFGNIRARTRMIVLYYFANSNNLLVMGTSNKSELLTGYFTKFGDGGADYLPIGDLYKTQVRALARQLKIPNKIISKTPTAGLWKGQTDEKELGLLYNELDMILLGTELNYTSEEISKRTGFTLAKINKVQNMIDKTVHKRKMPLTPKIGVRTIGLDRRE